MKIHQFDTEKVVEYENKMEELIESGSKSEINLVNFKKLEFIELDEREIIILMSLKLGMNCQETNNVLKKYGYGKLYAREIGDVIWIYSIVNNKKIIDVIKKIKNSTDRRIKC